VKAQCTCNSTRAHRGAGEATPDVRPPHPLSSTLPDHRAAHQGLVKVGPHVDAVQLLIQGESTNYFRSIRAYHGVVNAGSHVDASND